MLRRRASKRRELRILRDYPILTWDVHRAMVRCWLDGDASYPPMIRLDLLDGFQEVLDEALVKSRAAG
jgi:hypothetical protein